MTNIILCDVTASVSELKNDPVASAGAGCGYPVAIIDSNRPVFLLCARGSVGKNARSSGRERPGAIDNRTSKPIYFVIGQRDKRHHSGDAADGMMFIQGRKIGRYWLPAGRRAGQRAASVAGFKNAGGNLKMKPHTLRNFANFTQHASFRSQQSFHHRL